MLVIPRNFLGVVDTWLIQKGLPEMSQPSLNDASKAAIPLDLWRDHVHAAVAKSPGSARGFEIGAGVQFSHVGTMGYILANSQTFYELLSNYQLFEKWFYGCGWANLSQNEYEITISWDQRFTEFDRLLEQLHSFIIVNVISSACPSIGRPLRVEVTNDEQGEVAAYRHAFGCPVRFNSPELRVIYSADIVDTQVDLSEGELQSFWRESQRTLHDARSEVGIFARDVQREILHLLPTGARIDDVAKGLNLSRRSLQRRLSESGSSYRTLIDGIREVRARNLINDSNLSLNEIAFLLGYSEQSAFNHAYKRWTGLSPLAFSNG